MSDILLQTPQKTEPLSSKKFAFSVPEESQSKRLKTPPEIQTKYRYIQQLGQGSQGNVFLAEDLENGQKVAIKTIAIQAIKSWKEYDLFQREADVLKTLNCDGIAHFIEALEFLDIENPAAYIVQEYVEGSTIDKLISQGYHFNLNEVFDIALQLLETLSQLHDHEPVIIHRDIKFSNVILQKQNGQYKTCLIDFGAVANPQLRSGGSTVAGTFGYMPPEQLMGHPEPASDIYALGALIAGMLSGVSPSDMDVDDFRLNIAPYLVSVPAQVTAVLQKMLEPKVEDRLTSIEELKKYFQDFKNGNYAVSLTSKEKLSTIELSKKLRTVNSYRDEGNLEIWNSLQADIPRDVPTSLYKLSGKAPNELNDLSFLCLTGFWILLNTLVFMISLSVFDSTPAIGLLTFFLLPILLSFIICQTTHLSKFYIFILFATAISSYIGLAIVLILLLIDSINNHSIRLKNSHINHGVINTAANIVEYGHKTLATVVSIEPLDLPRIEQNLNDNDDMKWLMDKTVHSYALGEAKVLVRYKYQREKQGMSVDCYGEFEMDWNDKLNVGDVLPILYLEYGCIIQSMPFPLPLDQNIQLTSLITETIEPRH